MQWLLFRLIRKNIIYLCFSKSIIDLFIKHKICMPKDQDKIQNENSV